MPWYDALKNLFPQLKSLINIEVHITSKSNNTNKVDYNDLSKRATINLPNLTPEDKQELKNILPVALEEKAILLKAESKEIVNDFRAEDKSEQTQKILNLLIHLVPPEDIIIWRASLYLRKLFQEGKTKDIAGLKWQISQKYGTHGSNIANLCTAGYLEDFLLPSYNELNESTKDKEQSKVKFRALYQTIVEDLPFTIFVCYKMKEEEIEQTILNKVDQNLKYGLKFFNIHGIGKVNIRKIKETITKIEEKQILANKTITEENNIIFVKLEFK